MHYFSESEACVVLKQINFIMAEIIRSTLPSQLSRLRETETGKSVINPRTPRGEDTTPWRFSPVTFLMIPIAKIASAYRLLGIGDTF